MKKSLIALVLILVCATASFASVSFLVAPGVGEGKWALLGIYGGSHMGNGVNMSDDTNLAYRDATSMGLRVAYGLTNDLDLLCAYSSDSYTNLKGYIDSQAVAGETIDLISLGGSTGSLGIKYTLMRDGADSPVDVAVSFGTETSFVRFKPDYSGIMQTTDQLNGLTTYALGCVVSKKMDMFIPYGAIALKSLFSQPESRYGAGLALNLGVAIGLAENMAAMVELNFDNQSWPDNQLTGLNNVEASTNTNSSLALGFCYMI